MLRALVAALLLAVVPATAAATVTTSKRSKDFTCSGGTSYSYDFPVLSTSDLVVTKYVGSCGSASYVVLLDGVGYTATRTATGGVVTTLAACGAGYCLRVQRLVDYTQETSFKAQGTFSPAAHEAAFDKLTMEVQQLQDGLGQSEESAALLEAHIISSDDHTSYFKLGGRSGGQIAYGGTGAGDDLVLRSTTSGTTGTIKLGYELYVDPALVSVNTDMEISDDLTVDYDLHVGGDLDVADDLAVSEIWSSFSTPTDLYIETYGGVGDIWVGGFADFDQATYNLSLSTGTLTVPSIYGSATASQSLNLYPNSALSGGYVKVRGPLVVNDGSSTGLIYGSTVSGDNLLLSSNTSSNGSVSIGLDFVFNQSSKRVGINTMSPSTTLDVNGTLNAAGATTLGSTLAVTGNSALTGDLSAAGQASIRWTRENMTTNTTAPDAIGDCGRMFSTATDGVTLTLNNITAAYDGCEITLTAFGASGTQTVYLAIDSSDYIVGSCFGSSKVPFTTSSHKGVYLPYATQDMGDKITVRADSSNNIWHIMFCGGVWARIP